MTLLLQLFKSHY